MVILALASFFRCGFRLAGASAASEAADENRHEQHANFCMNSILSD